jgi:hypothetical protein
MQPACGSGSSGLFVLAAESHLKVLKTKLFTIECAGMKEAHIKDKNHVTLAVDK